ncbi:MAG: fibronectin type III domain-containing protein [Bacteroidetes bacterium]|nr:fibronectin type III domain-containing protein [Bacteroidota bacterium]
MPDAPTGLTATASGSRTIDLSWDEPSDDGGTAITGYWIEVSPDGSSRWTDLVDDTGSRATRYSETNLSPNTTRYYRVSAVNSEGSGASSNVVSATTEPLSEALPSVPTDVSAIASGSE